MTFEVVGGMASRPLDIDVNSGKAEFWAAYDDDSPGRYFRDLGKRLAYRSDDFVYQFLVSQHVCGPARNRIPLRVLDLGSAYGFNSMVLRFNRDFGFFVRMLATHSTREAQLRALARLKEHVRHEVHGVDGSEAALNFAQDARLHDNGLVARFADAKKIAAFADCSQYDLILASGVLGYLRLEELDVILSRAVTPGRTRFVAWPLYGFPTEALVRNLEILGLTVQFDERLRPQRRYASSVERQNHLERYQSMGLRISGMGIEKNLCVQQLMAVS